MAFSFYGFKISESEIIKKMKPLKSFGSRTIDLADAAKEFNFLPTVLSFSKKKSKGKAIIKKPSRFDLQKYLSRNLPVIIPVRKYLLNDQKPSKTGHFILLTAYKDGIYWYNDPESGKTETIDEDSLLLAWFPHSIDSSAYLLFIYPKKP